ncbi:MAG: hypothetical protein D6727_05015 [Gammaproteobacteria bacterium]|nr:MAG: hypothetical protein D6727_05015 [Gammaproteobacteria bacterium]
MQSGEEKDSRINEMQAMRWYRRPPLPVGLPVLLHPSGYRLVACPDGHPDRAELEAFLKSRYREVHGAEITSFFPVLLALRDADGRLQGVSGYRSAAGDRLFLEQYLEQPVERVIGDWLGWSVRRADIAEIGNFAALGCRRGQRLIELLIDFVGQQGHLWATFTGTRTIRLIMNHMGIPLHEVSAARRQQLLNSAENWGDYYSEDPRVVFAAVPAAARERQLGVTV